MASDDDELSRQLARIDRVQAAVPGSVIAVEGASEINNAALTFNGMSGLQGALALQQALYVKVHADPLLAGVAVDYFTGYGAGAIPVGPDPSVTPGLADYDTQHPYPNFNQAPARWVARSAALSNEPSGAGPAVYTETGYSSNNVSVDVQAKYELDLLMDTASQGISKTDLYELLDAYAPTSRQGDAGWGLFDDTGAPKPVAAAIHTLTTLLRATSASIPLGQLHNTIAGLPSTGNSLGITKSDGSDIIVVWNEPEIWDSSTRTEITAPIVPVTVDLGQAYARVQVFDPLVGTSPVASYANIEFVPLGLTDHPLLVEVSDTSPPTTTKPSPITTPSLPPPNPAASPTTVGAGPDQLVLYLAEAAIGGKDAQFVVAVDGTQIGGPQTVTAAAAKGEQQTLTLFGSFGAGSHVVTVKMLDGFTGNPVDAGRTLYVNAISLNGQTSFVNGAQRYNDPQSYTVRAPAAPLISNAGTQNTLTMTVSETAIGGQDARFLVSVDGQAVGGVQTITAAHAAGASQNIALTGTFGAGPHAVTIDFLNGFSGSPDDVGRTMYINAITLNGVTTTENASQTYNGPVSYTVAGAAAPPSVSVAAPSPAPIPAPIPAPVSAPVSTPVSAPTPAAPAASSTPPAAVTSGNVPVTFNWSPATQLTHLLAAEKSVGTGVVGSRAKVVALGDAATVGVVGTPGGRGTVSYPTQLADALAKNGLAATSNNFLGGGLAVDSRVTLLNGAIWSGAQAAGGQLIQTSTAGQGATFKPVTPVNADRVEIDYADSYDATFTVSVNGKPALATVQTGNTQSMKSVVVDLLAGQISYVTVTATTSKALFLEGMSLWNSNAPAIEIYNAGKGGQDSGVIGSGSLAGISQFAGAAGISPNLALIDYGTDDIVDNTEGVSQTVAHIALMVDSMRSINCDPIVLIPTSVSGYQNQFDALRSALETLSTTMNVPLIDLAATYGNNNGGLAAAGLLVDNIHPSPALYADIGSRIANLLTDAVTGTPLPVAHIWS